MTTPDIDKGQEAPAGAVVTRFAPSPTGRLHLGHALSAVLAHDAALAAGGRFRLRLEDIDRGRCRAEFAEAIVKDLRWLGLTWDGPILVQTSRAAAHTSALDQLRARGLLYACTCSRADIAAAAGAPHEGETAAYPGTCRGRREAPPGADHAWRLDLTATGLPMLQQWTDVAAGPRAGRADVAGDPVLMRRDGAPAYHLACVLDDAWQGVTMVVRGRDLEEATPVQRLLQQLLGLPAPSYLHHRLLLAADGRRLAKRDRAETLETLRAAGLNGAALTARLRSLPPTGPDCHLPIPG